jgi:hypothetical protein
MGANLLNIWAIGSFSRRTVVRVVSYLDRNINLWSLLRIWRAAGLQAVYAVERQAFLARCSVNITETTLIDVIV